MNKDQLIGKLLQHVPLAALVALVDGEAAVVPRTLTRTMCELLTFTPHDETALGYPAAIQPGWEAALAASPYAKEATP